MALLNSHKCRLLRYPLRIQPADFPASFWQCRVIYSWGRKYAYQLIWDCYFWLWIRTSFKSYEKGQDFYNINTPAPQWKRHPKHSESWETNWPWFSYSIHMSAFYLPGVPLLASQLYSNGVSPWGLFRPPPPVHRFPMYPSLLSFLLSTHHSLARAHILLIHCLSSPLKYKLQEGRCLCLLLFLQYLDHSRHLKVFVEWMSCAKFCKQQRLWNWCTLSSDRQRPTTQITLEGKEWKTNEQRQTF